VSDVVTKVPSFKGRLDTIKRSYATANSLNEYQSLDLGLKILLAETLRDIHDILEMNIKY
jgi:hypothetical protein